MRIFPWRFVLVVATAVSVIGFSKPATATTFNVTVGPGFNLVFDPASVTIHPGDQVKWTWASSGHSTTSGSPGETERHLGFWNSQPGEPPSLRPSIVPGRFRTTELRR